MMWGSIHQQGQRRARDDGWMDGWTITEENLLDVAKDVKHTQSPDFKSI